MVAERYCSCKQGLYLEKAGYIVKSRNALFLKGGNGIFTTVYGILLSLVALSVLDRAFYSVPIMIQAYAW
jgi:hypothetical protein